MEDKLNVYQKLAKARVLLQSKDIKKSGKNKYAGFEYFELSDVLPYINEIFGELGLLGKYDLTNDYAILQIIDVDSPDSVIVTKITADKEDCEIKMGQDKQSRGMQPIQRLGSVITYTKRYLYFNALEITDGEVIDALKPDDQKNKTEKEKLKEFIIKNKLDITKVATRFNLSKETKEEDYKKALASLQELDNVSLQEFSKGK